MLPDLKPADIINFHSPSRFSWIRLITGSYWNHTALVVGRCLTQEGEPDYEIVESICPSGVKVSSLRYNYGFDYDMAVYRHPHISDETRRLVIHQALIKGREHTDHPKGGYRILQALGIQYDLLVWLPALQELGVQKSLEVLRDMMCRSVDAPQIPHKQDRFVVCSELAQEGYAGGGASLIHDRFLALPRTFARLRHGRPLEQIAGKDKD